MLNMTEKDMVKLRIYNSLNEKWEVNEMVTHPNHYNKGEIEVIDVIYDWDLNFALGSAIKYIARCELKGDKKQDLEKAIEYLKMEIDRI